MADAPKYAVSYAERATGKICDVNGVRNVRPGPISRTYFDDIAAAEQHCHEVADRNHTLECWIELPDGERKGPIEAKTPCPMLEVPTPSRWWNWLLGR
jgi:hypothetical protein